MLWSEPAHEPNPRGPLAGGPIVPERKLLIVASATSGLWALDPTNGHMVWRIPIPEGGVTSPVPIAGALMLGTTRYGLFLISPLDGRVIDGIDLGTGFAQTPAAFGNRAFTMTNAGTLLGILVEPPLAPPRPPRRGVFAGR
jgi:outer membrane protein assembly factor BamB